MNASTITTGKSLRVHPGDNVLVALVNLTRGETVTDGASHVELRSEVAAKHKFAIRDLALGDDVIMYGILVGRATRPIAAGEVISTTNVRHETGIVHGRTHAATWTPPDVSRYQEQKF